MIDISCRFFVPHKINCILTQLLNNDVAFDKAPVLIFTLSWFMSAS